MQPGLPLQHGGPSIKLGLASDAFWSFVQGGECRHCCRVSHQLREKRAQQERDFAQRQQDGEREAALLKSVRADLGSAQKQRQRLRLVSVYARAHWGT